MPKGTREVATELVAPTGRSGEGDERFPRAIGD